MRFLAHPSIPVEAPKTRITASHPTSETRTPQGVAGFSLPAVYHGDTFARQMKGKRLALTNRRARPSSVKHIHPMVAQALRKRLPALGFPIGKALSELCLRMHLCCDRDFPGTQPPSLFGPHEVHLIVGRCIHRHMTHVQISLGARSLEDDGWQRPLLGFMPCPHDTSPVNRSDKRNGCFSVVDAADVSGISRRKAELDGCVMEHGFGFVSAQHGTLLPGEVSDLALIVRPADSRLPRSERPAEPGGDQQRSALCDATSPSVTFPSDPRTTGHFLLPMRPHSSLQ